MTTRVLTFESWVTEPSWFSYARSHPDRVPYLLSDRSQCQDPFFDLFAPRASDRRPMITGLCRCLKKFEPGDRYVYVTRLCKDAVRRRGLDTKSGPWYLGVASMVVVERLRSHDEAARQFRSRRYVVAPVKTPYPPGLAHNFEPVAAVSRESCIVHAKIITCGSVARAFALTPTESSAEQWRQHYSEYHRRQVEKKLRAAFCKVDVIKGREALALKFEDSPVMSKQDWENLTPQVMGRVVSNGTGIQLAQ